MGNFGNTYQLAHSSTLCSNLVGFLTCIPPSKIACYRIWFFSKNCSLRTTNSHYCSQHASSFTLPYFHFGWSVEITCVLCKCNKKQITFFKISLTLKFGERLCLKLCFKNSCTYTNQNEEISDNFFQLYLIIYIWI